MAEGRVVTVQAEVEVPWVPNFLRLTDGQTVPVWAIAPDGLRAIGEAWTQALLERAEEQKREASGG